MDRADRCWTCGKPRGLTQQRTSWSLRLPTPFVPRTGNPDDRPVQAANDLICSASVYRNGGTSESTHLCDDCLRVGIRAIKVQIDMLLEKLDAEHDKDKVLADLTERLGSVQLRYSNVCFDHNRMQVRLAAILPKANSWQETEEIRMARWEADRRPAKAEY